MISAEVNKTNVFFREKSRAVLTDLVQQGLLTTKQEASFLRIHDQEEVLLSLLDILREEAKRNPSKSLAVEAATAAIKRELQALGWR